MKVIALDFGEARTGVAISDPTGFGCHGVRWSPDGRKIIFAANSPATGRNIYTANADGSGLTQVTHNGNDDDPAWSKDCRIGKSIIDSVETHAAQIDRRRAEVHWYEAHGVGRRKMKVKRVLD